MRFLVVLLGVVWAALNLVAAYTFFTSGLTDKAAAKGLFLAQGPLITGGLLIGAFALILLVQSVRLLIAKQEPA